MSDSDLVVYTADGHQPGVPSRRPASLLLGLGAFAAGVGLAGGWLLHDVTSPAGTAVPAAVVEACGIFNAAYTDAAALADQANDAFDEDTMANPVSANEVWRARHQAAAEEATDLLFDAAQTFPGQWPWLPIAFELDQAQRVLGDPMSDSVSQQQALSSAAAACLER